ncbi:alpha/beta hydrolase [Microbacterium sp. KKR3/1]|uniref:alpha/beta hydrolase n=1 Tax=Microbacterium sp. KKR3/1 TaxID=2904241 RepID=UPI001E2D44C9|nr:alpha/beta hydrolase [Microbacterium sp. KKR3/1]MCE0509898.1 alpha/beta hydrolase [Microbacterium sp. KKR3/1]
MDETTRMLELLNSSFPALATMTPLEGRAAADSRIRPAANLDDAVSTDDRTVDAGTHDIPIRVYHPRVVHRDAPTTVYAHGGGFLHGSIAGHDGFCRRWARATEATVVSVGYRLAPEAGPGDARDDVVAVVDEVMSAGLADRGILLAGDSSGGNIAAGAAVVLRDRGASPVVAQALLYPFLDPEMSSDSHRTRASGYFITSELLAHYWRTFLSDHPDRFDADVSPLAVDDLSGLPPAVVVTAGLDPLCDEGAAYALRMREAGVPVILRHHPDQFHGFLTIPGYGPALGAAEILWSDLRSLITSDPKDHR